MHIADITVFYAPTSGGVRSYPTNKHRYLATQAGIRHSILVPGRTAAHDGDVHTDQSRAACVVLHDVAPQTWDRYQPFGAFVDGLRVPLTLLVVPDFHQAGDLRWHPRFFAAMDARVVRGDEIALPGHFHADDQPPPGGPVDFFTRRV